MPRPTQIVWIRQLSQQLFHSTYSNFKRCLHTRKRLFANLLAHARSFPPRAMVANDICRHREYTSHFTPPTLPTALGSFAHFSALRRSLMIRHVDNVVRGNGLVDAVKLMSVRSCRLLRVHVPERFDRARPNFRPFSTPNIPTSSASIIAHITTTSSH